MNKFGILLGLCGREPPLRSTGRFALHATESTLAPSRTSSTGTALSDPADDSTFCDGHIVDNACNQALKDVLLILLGFALSPRGPGDGGGVSSPL
jgi:hypothetical protein